MKMMLCSWYIFFEIPKCWKIRLCPPGFPVVAGVHLDSPVSGMDSPIVLELSN